MTRIRHLFLAAALALCVPAAAQAATIDAAKRCYFNGDTVVLKGSGFAPDGPVTFTVNGRRTSGTVITDGNGDFEANYEPPATADEDRLVIRASDSEGTVAKKRIFVTTERRVTADPAQTTNVRTWKAVFRLYGFGRGKAFVHYVAPNGKLRKTVKLGKLRGPCGRRKTDKRRVLPFANPDFGVWKLQFDTRRRFDRDTAKKRVIPVRVFRA